MAISRWRRSLVHGKGLSKEGYQCVKDPCGFTSDLVAAAGQDDPEPFGGDVEDCDDDLKELHALSRGSERPAQHGLQDLLVGVHNPTLTLPMPIVRPGEVSVPVGLQAAVDAKATKWAEQ